MLTSISASLTLFMGLVIMQPLYGVAQVAPSRTEDPLPQRNPGCGGLWEKSNITHSCYQFNGDSLSWYKARESCQKRGADLLSITSLEEWQYLSDRLRDTREPFWMGLYKTYDDGWQWLDGSPLTLMNSLQGLLGSWSGAFGAYLPGNHEWHGFNPSQSLSYICKKYTTPREQETFDQWKHYPTKCEYGWYPYNRYCYKLQMEMQMWDDASTTCQHNGSELMSVTSFRELEVIHILLENETVNLAWIGMEAVSGYPNTFQWSDGSAVTFSYWSAIDPHFTKTNNKLCVASYRKDQRWRLKQCNDKLFSICKKHGQLETEYTNEDKCGEGWEIYGSFCYRVDESKRTFQEASSGYYCGSPLAIITNRFEQAFISSMISSKGLPEGKYLWIGLQDQTNSKEYTWIRSDGYQQPVTYTNWGANQPSRNGGCITMRNGQHHGLWEVKDCDTFKAMSLCKKNLSPTIKDWSNSQGKNMGSEDMCDLWESEAHFQYCYKVFNHEKVLKKRTWEEAEQFCQGFGARLVSFSHLEEEKFVEELLSTMFHPYEKRQFWIGFYNRNLTGEGSWQWSDGTPVVSPFLADMDEVDETVNCAVYRADKKVTPMRCDAKLEWICKMPKGLPPKLPAWHVKDAPWVFFQGNEYLPFNEPSPFEVYEFSCSWIGAELLTIHSPAEQNFILKRIKKASKEKKKWWIGLQYESSGTQRWKGGSPILYTNWENKLNDSDVSWNNSQCAYISSDTGLWGFSDCADHNLAICKTEEKFLVEVDLNKDSNNGSCPAHWLHYEGKCFFVHNGEDGGPLDSWFAAQEYCNTHDGNLVSIKNKIEQAFVVMQLFGEKNGFWINLRKDDYEKWENGISKKYSNWSPINTPHDNINSSTENPNILCGFISSNDDVLSTGKWYLANCNTKGYGFVCEKKQGPGTLRLNKTDMYPVEDIMEYGHKTYRVISSSMTWYDALTSCQRHGARLASVTDDFHQAFLSVIVNRLGYKHWIGFFSPDHGRHFEWADLTISSFTAWKDEGSPFDGNCAYIDIDGFWRTEDCTTELAGAICLMSNNYTTTTDPPAVKPRAHHVLVSIVVTTLAVALIVFMLSCYLLKGKKICSSEISSLQKMQCSRARADPGDTEGVILITELNSKSET